MTSTIQNILIILGIIVIAIIGIYLFVNNGDVSLNNNQVQNQISVQTSEFVQKLNDLQTMELSGAIFNDPRFTSLIDYTVEPVPVPRGKDNPFIPNN